MCVTNTVPELSSSLWLANLQLSSLLFLFDTLVRCLVLFLRPFRTGSVHRKTSAKVVADRNPCNSKSFWRTFREHTRPPVDYRRQLPRQSIRCLSTVVEQPKAKRRLTWPSSLTEGQLPNGKFPLQTFAKSTQSIVSDRSSQRLLKIFFFIEFSLPLWQSFQIGIANHSNHCN